MNQFDVEETEILEAFESGKLKHVEGLKEEINRHREIAAAKKAYFKIDELEELRWNGLLPLSS